MQIQNTNYTPNFQARLVSRSLINVKDTKSYLDVYSISRKDIPFLEKLSKKVVIKDLMPNTNISKDRMTRWQEMFQIALSYVGDIEEKAFLLVKDKKPCGIFTYKPDKKRFILDCVCTWPIEKGKKVALAGQTLFKSVFEDFMSSSAKKMELRAIINGPFDNVTKYSRLGFKENGAVNDHIIAMSTNRYRVKDKLCELNKLIKTQNFKNSPEINLLDNLTT